MNKVQKIQKFEEFLSKTVTTNDKRYIKGKNIDFKAIKPVTDEIDLKIKEVKRIVEGRGLNLNNIPESHEEKLKRGITNKESNAIAQEIIKDRFLKMGVPVKVLNRRNEGYHLLVGKNVRIFVAGSRKGFPPEERAKPGHQEFLSRKVKEYTDNDFYVGIIHHSDVNGKYYAYILSATDGLKSLEKDHQRHLERKTNSNYMSSIWFEKEDESNWSIIDRKLK